MKQAILVPGVIAGIVLGLVYMGISLLGAGMSYGAQESLGLLAIAVAAAAAQIVAIQRHPLGSQANYPARYFAGMLAGAVTALVYGLITWLYFAVINPQHLERFYDAYLERARTNAATEAEREQMITAAERMRDFIMDPFSQAMVQFGTVLMIALLVGILTAAFARPGIHPRSGPQDLR